MCVVNHAWYHIWCNKSSSDLPNMLFIPSEQACTQLTVANKKSWRHNSVAPKVCCPYSKSFGSAIFYCQNTFWRHKFSSEGTATRCSACAGASRQLHRRNSHLNRREEYTFASFFGTKYSLGPKKNVNLIYRGVKQVQLWMNLYKIILIYIYYNTITLA